MFSGYYIWIYGFVQAWGIFPSKYVFRRLVSFVNHQLKNMGCSGDHRPDTILIMSLRPNLLGFPGYCMMRKSKFIHICWYGMLWHDIWPWLKNVDPKLDTRDYTYLKRHVDFVGQFAPIFGCHIDQPTLRTLLWKFQPPGSAVQWWLHKGKGWFLGLSPWDDMRWPEISFFSFEMPPNFRCVLFFKTMFYTFNVLHISKCFYLKCLCSSKFGCTTWSRHHVPETWHSLMILNQMPSHFISNATSCSFSWIYTTHILYTSVYNGQVQVDMYIYILYTYSVWVYSCAVYILFEVSFHFFMCHCCVCLLETTRRKL